MKILFLDDDKRRKRDFRSKVPFAKIVSTAGECISALMEADEPWDMVFLDHDLGDEVFVESVREDCGMEVVRWIVHNKPEIEEIIVHSHNTPAGHNMLSSLKSADYRTRYVPFGTLIKSLNVENK